MGRSVQAGERAKVKARFPHFAGLIQTACRRAAQNSSLSGAVTSLRGLVFWPKGMNVYVPSLVQSECLNGPFAIMTSIGGKDTRSTFE